MLCYIKCCFVYLCYVIKHVHYLVLHVMLYNTLSYDMLYNMLCLCYITRYLMNITCLCYIKCYRMLCFVYVVI